MTSRRHWVALLAVGLLLATLLVPVAGAERQGPRAASTSSPVDGPSVEAPTSPLTLSPRPADPASAEGLAEADEDFGEGYDDEVGLVSVDTSCASRYRGAEAQVNSNEWDTSRGALVWTLERDGREIHREPFESFDGEYTGPHHLDDLESGRYTLLVLTAVGGQIIDWIDFEILECVSAVGGCRSVTFTNPAANPTLRVTYGAGDDDGSDDEPVDDRTSVTVPPGESRTVSTQRRIVGWEAWRVLPEQRRKSFGGEEWDLGVSQHCGDTMTRAAIRCASGARATADFWVRPPRDLPAQFKVIDFHELIDSGSVGSDRHLRLRLRPSDLYSLRVYTKDAVLPYDLMYFAIEPCLRVQPTCDGVTLTNPHEYATYAVRYRIDDGREKTIKVGSGKTKPVRVPDGSVMTWTRPVGAIEDWPEFVTGESDGGTAEPLSRC